MRWLERFLHLPARPLQIPEILAAAKEHLLVVALEGLERRYLPVRLSIAVASDDFRALAPFARELRGELQGVIDRLASRPRLGALSAELQVDLVEAEDLAPGAAPRFHATFPEARAEASWRPGVAVPAVREPFPPPRTGLFELVLTTASGERTGLQALYLACLDEALPARAIDPGLGDARLTLDAGDTLRDADTGEPWRAEPPRVRGLETALPEELAAELPGDVSTSRLLRFHRPGRAEVLWAPRGALLIGRLPELVHWVPGGVPRNLSGRHLALVRGDAARSLAVVDLESTNGTYVGGRRLRAGERVVLTPPATVEAGTEGTVRLDLRWPDSVDSGG